jgi:protoporphyrinogen oxidase
VGELSMNVAILGGGLTGLTVGYRWSNLAHYV